MLSSIHPFGERARRNRWGITASAHVAGSLAGGALAGATAGTLGAVLLRFADVRAPVIGLLAILVVSAALFLDGRPGHRIPSIRRQVDEDWLNAYRGWVYGAGFGVQLGFALDVIVTSAAVYATFALALLSGSFTAGLAIGATFGLVRGAVILAGARIDSPGSLRSFHRRLQARAASARRMVVTAEAALLAGFVLVLVSG